MAESKNFAGMPVLLPDWDYGQKRPNARGLAGIRGYTGNGRHAVRQGPLNGNA